MLVPDGQGGIQEAGIADRIPVDAAFIEPGQFVVLGRGKGFFAQGLAEGFPFLGTQERIEPVIAQAHGQGHFPGIQEMRGIPVPEATDGFHFLQGAVGIGLRAVDPPGIAQPENAFDGLAGRIQHPPADQDALQDGLFE